MSDRPAVVNFLILFSSQAILSLHMLPLCARDQHGPISPLAIIDILVRFEINICVPASSMYVITKSSTPSQQPTAGAISKMVHLKRGSIGS